MGAVGSRRSRSRELSTSELRMHNTVAENVFGYLGIFRLLLPSPKNCYYFDTRCTILDYPAGSPDMEDFMD